MTKIPWGILAFSWLAFWNVGCVYEAPVPCSSPDYLSRWVGNWADAGDAQVNIDTAGHFKANLVLHRSRLRPDYLFTEDQKLEGELSPSVRLGGQLDYTL